MFVHEVSVFQETELESSGSRLGNIGNQGVPMGRDDRFQKWHNEEIGLYRQSLTNLKVKQSSVLQLQASVFITFKWVNQLQIF